VISRPVGQALKRERHWEDLLSTNTVTENGTAAAHGAAPILVVGTTGDPATPYAWSKSLAEQLDSGQLLTWEGNGHTAYGGDASCVNDAVDAYLISGTMPKKGLTCHGNE